MHPAYDELTRIWARTYRLNHTERPIQAARLEKVAEAGSRLVHDGRQRH